ncbi:MAG TPA: carboxypeptidase regulatory-like domain-containing protein [bacterium]|nr:carboxypeptidase regulatory-like domain-containing protein [bacterium]
MLLVADREIVIGEDSNGEMTVTTPDGDPIRPIYQAITPEDSIVFGTPDPSGTFELSPEGLLPGTTYTWVVFNLYGNSPAFMGDSFGQMRSFSYSKQINLPVPQIVSPPDSAVISSETVKLEWTVDASTSLDPVANFHIYLYMEEGEGDEEEGTSFAFLVYDAVTSNTFLELDAETYLVNGRYDFKVIAENAQGDGRASESSTFYYSQSSGTLRIATFFWNTSYSPARQSSLSFTEIEIESEEDGTNVPLPLGAGGGNETGITVKPGRYKVTVSKDGYTAASGSGEVLRNSETRIDIVLTKLEAKIKGSVVDENDLPLENAVLRLTDRKDPSLVFRQTTDHLGNYVFTVSTGVPFSLSASKNEYTTSFSVAVSSLAAGSEFNIDDYLGRPLRIHKSTSAVLGIVKNENGFPIVNASVTAEKETARTLLTDSSGAYSFIVEPGTWTFRAEKAGFTAQSEQRIYISGGTSLEKEFILQSRANRVTGRVSDGRKSIKDAVITVSDSSGAFVLSAKTDIFGQYSVNLAAGKAYTIFASKAGYTSPVPSAVSFDAGDSGVTVSGLEHLLTPNDIIFSGIVLSAEGIPLEEARVEASGNARITGYDGSFSLSLPEGEYDVTAVKEGFASDYISVTASPGDSFSGQEFRLAPNAARISGAVRTASDLVYNAEVLLSTSVSFSKPLRTVSNYFGEYVFHPSHGAYYLKAVLAGFQSGVISVTVNPGEVSLENEITFTRYAGTLRGKAADENQAALPGVLVTLYEGASARASSSTGPDGKFSFEMTPGTYTVKLEKTGYVSLFMNNRVISFGSVTDLGTGLLEKTVYTVGGEVKDARGNPVTDAEVLLSGESFTRTSSIGYFEGGIDSAGTYQLSFVKSGYRILQSTFTVPPSADLSAVMEKEYGVIKGTVTDENSAPLSGIPVSVNGKTLHTGPAGNYTSGELSPGSYAVSIATSGYPAKSIKVSVLDRTTTWASIVLESRTYSAGGTVVDESSSPVSGVSVFISGEDGFSSNGVSGSSGTFTFSSLPDGDYAISVFKTGYVLSEGPASFTVSGSSLTLSFRFEKLDNEILLLIRSSSTVITDASVKITGIGETAGYFGSLSYDSQNRLRISNLMEGEYQIQVTRTGYKLHHSTYSAGNSYTVDMEENRGSVYGVVLKSSQPFSGAEVLVYSAVTGELSARTVTEGDGSYALELPAGKYEVKARVPEHAAVPQSRSFQLTASSLSVTDAGDLDFSLISTPISRFRLVPPGSTFVGDGSRYKFSIQAEDSSGKSVFFTDQPVFEVAPATAGIFDAEHYFRPNQNYFGKVGIVPSIRASELETYEAYIFYRVTKRSVPVNLRGPSGMELLIPAQVEKSSLTVLNTITSETKSVSSVRRNAGTKKVAGDSFAFYPNDFQFSAPVTLTIPVPERYRNSPDSLSVGYWNSKTLEWEDIGGTYSGGNMVVRINHFSEYAVMNAVSGSGLESLTFQPNPFSPHIRNMKISYVPLARSGTSILTTIRIYTILGEEVRTLAENVLQGTGEAQEIEWDGRNENGSLCRSGRYIAVIKFKDGLEEKEMHKVLALIK